MLLLGPESLLQYKQHLLTSDMRQKFELCTTVINLGDDPLCVSYYESVILTNRHFNDSD